MRSEPSPLVQLVVGLALLAASRYGRRVLAFLVEMVDEANQQGRTLLPGGKQESDDAYRSGFVTLVRALFLVCGLLLSVGGVVRLLKAG